jgi:hypothetical protein
MIENKELEGEKAVAEGSRAMSIFLIEEICNQKKENILFPPSYNWVIWLFPYQSVPSKL